MPKLIASPQKIPVPGNKLIEEYIGRVNSGDSAVSAQSQLEKNEPRMARMDTDKRFLSVSIRAIRG